MSPLFASQTISRHRASNAVCDNSDLHSLVKQSRILDFRSSPSLSCPSVLGSTVTVSQTSSVGTVITSSAARLCSSARFRSLPLSHFGHYTYYGELTQFQLQPASTDGLSGNKNGPPFLRNLSRRLSKRLTAWQTLVVTMLWLYISRNFAKIMGLECPEPLANLYNRSYFRATWITTALDAGFWTAMRIRRKWLRDLASMVFSVFYLFAAEQADEKVRKVRGTLTVDHLRVSWNKGTTPYLSFFTRLMRPKLARYSPRMIRIPRPQESSYKEPIIAWLYYDAPFSTINSHTKIILDVPGGGFVAMNPRTNDDKLLAWSGRTGLPVLSLDYKKAPEYPYPYALNECYDVYHTLIATRGRCIGLSGESRPRIILTGDSAGGNLATGVVLMVLQSAAANARRGPGQETLPTPDGLVLMYPGLDMNIGNWMTDEQMSLIQDRRTRSTNKNVLRRKSEDYYKLTPETPHPSDDEEDKFFAPRPFLDTAGGSETATATTPTSPNALVEAQPVPEMGHLAFSSNIAHQKASVVSSKPRHLKTRLAMSSMISYFNDRILTPEMMRAMIILYVGPHNRPDFSTDFLLSPLLAPEALLAEFPKTCFLTGERDPLVDDTVIFAGRLRQAKYNAFVQRKELGLLNKKDIFNEKDHVEVALIPGISHGFVQFVSIFPEGWKHIFRCARWMEEIFANAEKDSDGDLEHRKRERHHRRNPTESSGDEDRPLEMSTLRSSTGSSIGGKDRADEANGHRRGTRGRGRGTKGDGDVKRQRSMVSLASEDDLLGRRMKGLAGGLMGMTADGAETP
ncbi:hypothetical protein MMC18_001312 [Xylographa bjoerkii]|nr:hypothetical protein [Xylographa bjoerkii]